MYLNELEEILEMTNPTLLIPLIDPLFKRIALCIQSPHFQVAERALFLWNNDTIAAFISDHRVKIVPLLYPALYHNTQSHWNPTVQQLTEHITQQFQSMDTPLFEKVKNEYIAQYVNIHYFCLFFFLFCFGKVIDRQHVSMC